MGEFYINDTSLDMTDWTLQTYLGDVQNMFTTALFTLTNVFLQVGKDNVAPIYVINLLISDLIHTIFTIYYSGLMASVCFMVCIALERYLVIACPLWYRFRRTIKISVVVCVLVWIISLVYCFSSLFWNTPNLSVIIYCIFFLLPLPLLIFFLVRTLKVLSASISVHADEKRRIVAMLVLVLVIYTLLFLPTMIFCLKEGDRCDTTINSLPYVSIRLSPLADLVLYVFMRKGAIDKLLASVCCCRMDNNDVSGSTV
uniref:G-protein coupled receptors family 1 profile domain-containing protein n=1 Tax=Sander lucioperca TaxID=283035 RepID=A0A8C9Y623_SANLU